ncbi:TadA family conjugal transfer-associated ATPase [Microbacterium sp. W1N]|uniref:TadA family conjugal transfer-associated ATPase n=1 Tax=Microbacterium festucae TaxID=2977531 RepID=UPI0021BF5459|nr:TadA family conjugal transfer-associated ATPase [Microbacterium festucae]MCT9820998.1 TadA family conjugal transfer-associated ATPase [Microbacterium festucae]
MSEPFVVRPRGAPSSVPGAVAPARRRVLPDHPALASLRPHLADPDVTDVFVNGGGALFIDRGRGAERVPGWAATEAEVRELAVTLIGLGGRHLDDLAPLVDVRWEHGARVHAVLPPVAVGGAVISIRLPSTRRLDLDALGRQGMFDAATGAVLERFVADRENVLVSGATGTGKTTMLAAMLGRVPAAERIVTIEDVAELAIDHPHHVRLESRQPNLEGAGAVGLARLVREALRMRPDRLVVGECRGEEVRELLSALNTGHDGGAGTIHAGGMDDVPARLEALGALAGLDDRALARQVASAVGAVVHLARGADGIRRVAAIARPVITRDRLEMAERT